MSVREMLAEIDAAEVYTREEIVPIPAQCVGKYKGSRRHSFTGIDAIKAPALRGCRCFYCGAKLRPHPDFPKVVDAETRRKMERAKQPQQLSMEVLA